MSDKEITEDGNCGCPICDFEAAQERSIDKSFRTFIHMYALADAKLVDALKRKPKTDEKKYEFTASSSALINLSEIAVDMNRNNQIVEVVVKGKDHAKGHWLLVHSSLVDKARLLKHTFDKVVCREDAPSAAIDIFNSPKVLSTEIPITARTLFVWASDTLQHMTPVSSTVYALNANGRNFRETLKMLEYVKKFPLWLIDESACEVVVRSR